jgi:predicted helicase
LVERPDALKKVFAGVEKRMDGVCGAVDRQDVIHELCQNLITIAFPTMAKQMGVIYTPAEIVDFINQSSDDVLFAEKGLRLTDPGVMILDPFAGTGTFVVRMLYTGLIRKEDMRRKHECEITCHEMCLFPWYIGRIAIESVYHEIMGHQEYVPFRWMRLVDTFAEYEKLNADGDSTSSKNTVLLRRGKRKATR